MIEIRVKLFNSLCKYGSGNLQFPLTLPENTTVGEVLQCVKIPENEIFLLMHNGRNIMRGFGFGSGIETGHVLNHGDTVAFSGAVPFSRGYGAAVV